jgi:hypothetical protein
MILAVRNGNTGRKSCASAILGIASPRPGIEASFLYEGQSTDSQNEGTDVFAITFSAVAILNAVLWFCVL